MSCHNYSDKWHHFFCGATAECWYFFQFLLLQALKTHAQVWFDLSRPVGWVIRDKAEAKSFENARGQGLSRLQGGRSWRGNQHWSRHWAPGKGGDLDFYSSYFKLNDELQWLNLLLLLAHHPSNFRNKNGIKWEKFPSGQTSPSPSLGTPMSQNFFKIYFAL